MLYLSHLIPDSDMADLLDGYDLGVESIEFSIGYCLDAGGGRVTAYRQRLEEMGAKGPLSLHGPFLDLNPVSWDAKVAQVTRERFSQVYGAALELGAEKIVYHTCFVPTTNLLDGWTQRMISFWRDFMEDKGAKISVCLENVFDPSYAPLGEIARGVDHPAFGLCLDVGHAHCFSADPVQEWIWELAPYIRHFHLHDNHGKQDEHLGIGQGDLPWMPVLEAIQERVPWADATIENPDRRACEVSLAALEDFSCH